MLSPPVFSLPPDHRYRPGDVVADKFRLIRPLGKGGMGVVWVAQHEILDLHVAIKIIDLRHVSRPKVVSARVLQEARTAARLGHPAICRVFDFGETRDGDPFVVTELLHGETLADVLKRERRKPATEAVGWLLPIAEALALAHGKGIVHRDVKPENVFLSHDDITRIRPKLLDFGIARFVQTDQKLTLDGTLLGTPHYMSPEQARGEAELDARTDVWSFSVLLYELVTGRLPFDGDNYNALLWAVGHDEPRSILEHGVGDVLLSAILQRGLKKNADDRWDTMRALGEQLAHWLHAQGLREDVCGASLRATWLEGTPLDPGPDPALLELETATDPPPDRTRTSPSERPPPVLPQPPPPPRTGVFELGARGPETRSGTRPRRWLAAGVCLLAVLLALLVVATRARTEPTPTMAGSDIELRHAGRPARTDLALPMLMATEVSSVMAVPSVEPSAEPVTKRVQSGTRPRNPHKIVPERYDLGF